MGVDIRIEHLTKSFGKQLIWGDVTLTVPAGEICVMLGPSGTGKPVLLKTLIGLLNPDRRASLIAHSCASAPEFAKNTRPGVPVADVSSRSRRSPTWGCTALK